MARRGVRLYFEELNGEGDIGKNQVLEKNYGEGNITETAERKTRDVNEDRGSTR